MTSESQPPQPACRTARNGQFKWGRIISLAGALGLCVSFFMPQIGFPIWFGKGPVVTIDPIGCVQTGGETLVSLCMPFFAAVLLTPLLAFRASPRVDAAKGTCKFLAWSQCAICLSVLITGLGWVIYSIVYKHFDLSLPLLYGLLAVGIVALLLAVVALVRSPLPRKAAATQFALWAFYLPYFAFVATGQDVIMYVGLWLSIAASGALVIGSVIDWFQCRPVKETLR